MQIQTFTGANLGEALSQVKLELGEDAIILTSRRAEDPARLPAGHTVEVVAALPQPPQRRPRTSLRTGEPKPWQPPRVNRDGSPAQEPPARPDPAEARPVRAALPVEFPARPAAALPVVPATAPSTSPAIRSDELGELRQELLELKALVRGQAQTAAHGAHKAWSAAHDQVLRQLCGKGVSRPLACAILDELAGDGSSLEARLPAALARRLPCQPVEALAGRRVEAFVGPTGVGKTTALAKILLDKELGHRRAGILSLDTKRVAAVEQSRRLAAILHAPLETVYRPSELDAALERLSGCDLVLVDTPGAGPRERLALERTRAFLKQLKPAHTHVVVPASMRLEDQLAVLSPWKAAGADRLLVTKLDEAIQLGGLLELAEQAGLPLSWVSTGPRIPDDLARPTGLMLAGWLLKPDTLGTPPADERSAGLARLQALVGVARGRN